MKKQVSPKQDSETECEGAAPEAREENKEPQENAELAAAKSALEKAKADAEDFKRKWYSVTAEYENYRRRTAGESAKRYKEGRADVVKGLFPIADNLERALAACKEEGTRKGIEMVKASFDKLLEAEGITVIDPKGEPFDAEKHEAIAAFEGKEGETSGSVKEVYQKGYEQNGKVLRFAQVTVVK